MPLPHRILPHCRYPRAYPADGIWRRLGSVPSSLQGSGLGTPTPALVPSQAAGEPPPLLRALELREMVLTALAIHTS